MSRPPSLGSVTCVLHALAPWNVILGNFEKPRKDARFEEKESVKESEKQEGGRGTESPVLSDKAGKYLKADGEVTGPKSQGVS